MDAQTRTVFEEAARSLRALESLFARIGTMPEETEKKLEQINAQIKRGEERLRYLEPEVKQATDVANDKIIAARREADKEVNRIEKAAAAQIQGINEKLQARIKEVNEKLKEADEKEALAEQKIRDGEKDIALMLSKKDRVQQSLKDLNQELKDLSS